MHPYRKPESAELLTIGEDKMIVCDGLHEALAIDDEEALIWEAIDRCGDFNALLESLAQALPDKAEEACRQSLRDFLDRLVRAGLLDFDVSQQLQKSDDVFSEFAGGELLVWSRSARKVHVFNEASAVLWEALDTFSDLDSLSHLAVDAWPDRDPITSRRLVTVLVATLFDAGLVRKAQRQESDAGH